MTTAEEKKEKTKNEENTKFKLNDKEKTIVGLINQLSELASDEKTTQQAIDSVVNQIQQNTRENIQAQMENAEHMQFPKIDIDGDMMARDIKNMVLKNNQRIGESIEHERHEMEKKSNGNVLPKFIFTRVREVKKPGKAHPTDAGIDFYVPDEKAWDEEFKNKVYEMSRNPPIPPDGSEPELVGFTPGYETIGGEHMPMNIRVQPGGHVAIPSGIKTIIPVGLGMMFVNKSGIATKLKLDHSACLVDSEYRDEIIMCFFNNGTEPVHIHPGMKITQGLIVPIINMDIQEVLNCVYEDMGKDTDRGGGFGSSGIK